MKRASVWLAQAIHPRYHGHRLKETGHNFAVATAIMAVVLPLGAMLPTEGAVKEPGAAANPNALGRYITKAVAAPVEAIKKQPPKTRMHVAGWLTGWDQSEGMKTYSENSDVFTEMSPFWYGVGPDGSIAPRPGAENADVLAQIRAKGTLVIPTVANGFDGQKIHDILVDPAKKDRHLGEIMSRVIAMNYDGIDLDYENLKTEDRDDFNLFVAQLAERLHGAGKLLSITVQPKTSEPGDPWGAAAQDYAVIGTHADRVRIMAYDKHWVGSTPGPVAPLDWVERVVAFTVTAIPPQKVELGIASYGYQWKAGTNKGKALVYDQIAGRIASSGVPVAWDENSASPWISFNEAGADWLIWFENSRSVSAKVEMAKRYNVGGVAFWRLGREDKGAFQAFR